MSINNKNLINEVCENIRNLKNEDLDKAIKKVNEEEIIEDCKNLIVNLPMLHINSEAIQGLLDLYNQTKNKLAEYENQMDLDYVDENYVSKDKIRERIEELYETKQYWTKEVISILQELLKENK